MDSFNTISAGQVLDRAREKDRASVFEGNTQKPLGIYTLTLALDTATLSTKPYRLGFQFKSVYVQAATDTGVSVNFRPNTDDSFQGAVPIKLNDSFSYSEPLAAAYLDWSAQAGKTITLVFFINGDFRPGSTVSVSSGGVSVSSGTAYTVTNTIVNLTATSLLSLSTTRKKGTIINRSAASIWLGPSTITANNNAATSGIELVPGDSFVWTNSAQLFGIAVAATNANDIQILEES